MLSKLEKEIIVIKSSLESDDDYDNSNILINPMHNNNTDLDSLTTARKGPHGEATNEAILIALSQKAPMHIYYYYV